MRVGHQQLARLGEDRRDDHHLDRPLEVVEADEHHRLAAAGGDVLHHADEPADRDRLAVGAVGQRGQAAGDRPRELLAAVVERVARDVEAEGLLLGGQQLVARHLVAGRSAGRAPRRPARPPPPIAPKRDSWPAARSLRRRAAWRHGGGERLEHPEAGGAGGVEGAAADEALQGALVDLGLVDAAAEVPDRLERAARVARREDRGHGVLPHALHRRQAEADLRSPRHREVGAAHVDVRRQHREAHVGAGGHVERHAVLRVHHRAEQRGHVLGRVVRLEVGGPVGEQRVAGGVALVERVVAGRLAEAPEALGHPAGSVPLARQPSMNSSFSEAIRTLSFLPTALRRSSARDGREPGDLAGRSP